MKNRTISIIKLQKRRQHGFNLVELLIAMLLGSLVMTGIMSVFISTKKSSQTLEAEAELQENARFAFSVMNSVIQKAGNFGCKTASDMTTRSLVNSGSDTFRPWRVIEGWEAKNTAYGKQYTVKPDRTVTRTPHQHWSSSAGASIDSGTKSVRHSDILKVWYSENDKTTLNAISGGVLSFTPMDLKVGDILVLNDCQSVTFAQVCTCEDDECEYTDSEANISPAACDKPGNKTFDSSGLNIPSTEIRLLDEAIFFVGKRGDDRKNIPALFVRYLGDDTSPGNKIEILEGVESLQLLYGEDANNDNSPDYYVSANQVSDWNKIVSLKISLLLRSTNNNRVIGKQSVNFNGREIKRDTLKGQPEDRYLRRVFTSTIALRNRNIGY